MFYINLNGCKRSRGSLYLLRDNLSKEKLKLSVDTELQLSALSSVRLRISCAKIKNLHNSVDSNTTYIDIATDAVDVIINEVEMSELACTEYFKSALFSWGSTLKDLPMSTQLAVLQGTADIAQEIAKLHTESNIVYATKWLEDNHIVDVSTEELVRMAAMRKMSVEDWLKSKEYETFRKYSGLTLKEYIDRNLNDELYEEARVEEQMVYTGDFSLDYEVLSKEALNWLKEHNVTDVSAEELSGLAKREGRTIEQWIAANAANYGTEGSMTLREYLDNYTPHLGSDGIMTTCTSEYIYYQNAPNANETYSMTSAGTSCATFAFATMLSINTNTSILPNDIMTTSAGHINVWDTDNQSFPNAGHTYSTDMSIIDRELSEGRTCVIHVGNHWVSIVGRTNDDYICIDPWGSHEEIRDDSMMSQRMFSSIVQKYGKLSDIVVQDTTIYKN